MRSRGAPASGRTARGPAIPSRPTPGWPRLSSEPNANLSFKCPESDVEMIEEAARRVGFKKSAFMREAAVEKALKVLASQE
jgi:hypothetical protein